MSMSDYYKKRGRGGQGRGSQQKMWATNIGIGKFDLAHCRNIFPNVRPTGDEPWPKLAEAIAQRNAELLLYSAEEMQRTQTFVTRVQGVLETLLLKLDGCDEVRQVGSFRHGTILPGHKTADFVVVLKTLPTIAVVQELSLKVANELRQNECVMSNVTNRGFELSNVQATVRVLVTVVPSKFKDLDETFHLDPKLMVEHFNAIKHSCWFENNANKTNIKVLIRILKDIRGRFQKLEALTSWTVDILSHYCVMNCVEGKPLPIEVAFYRAFSVMSSGIFLPSYNSTVYPAIKISPVHADIITGVAQNMLRVLSHGGYKQILGLTTATKQEIVDSESIWPGRVLVSRMIPVYQKLIENNEQETEDEELGEGSSGETFETQNTMQII